MKLFNKACKGGEMEACSNLGFMYQYGKGVKVDKIRAIESITKRLVMREIGVGAEISQ